MKKLIAVLSIFLFIDIYQSHFAHGGAATTIPIKNLDPKQHEMTKHEVYWIYTMRTRFWNDGTKITVFYLNFDNPIHEQFVKNVLGSTPYQFQQSVNTYVNVGNASYFRRVESESEMYKQVSRTNGAVGYVSDQVLLINGGNSNVKEIRITD